MLPFRSLSLLAVRSLLRHRRGSAAIIATLSVLAAVLIAMSSLGYNLLMSPWTYDSERYGVLRHGVAGSGQERYGYAPDEYRALRDAGLFEALVASQRVPVAFGDGNNAARSRVLIRTTADALAVTDAQPLLGRFVRAGEAGAERKLVISHALWEGEFGARTDVLGESLLLDGTAYEIVGVMPPRYHFMGGDFWTAHLADPATDTSTGSTLVLNFKLARGDHFDDLTPRLAAVTSRLVEDAPAGRYPRGWQITPLRVIDAVTGPQRPAMLLVMVGALALLILGVLNVAALLVARQISDTGQIATRKALGESRRLGVAVVFVESLLIAAISLLCALGLGKLLFQHFVGLIAVEWVPRELEGAFAYSTPALWTLPLMAVLIALLLTLVRLPGLLRIDAGSVVRVATRSGGRRGDLLATRLLSGLQITIAAAVLVASLAIGTGARSLLERDVGFDVAATQHTTLVFPRERYTTGADRIAAMDRMGERLQQEGAVAIGFTEAAPMQRYTRSGILSAGSGVALLEPIHVDYHVAHGQLGSALGLRVREGRFLDPAIDRADAEPVVVITRLLAERLATPQGAVGASITVAGGNGEPVARRIVGVVDDVRHESPLSAARPTVYVPYAQDAVASAQAGGQVAMLVRWPSAGANGVPDAARLQSAVALVDPWIAIQEVTTLATRAERSVAGITLARHLFAGFALLGVLLATLGIAAVAELAVQRQRHEIAVRSAVGATARQVLSSVLAGSMRVAVPAALAGAALAWLLAGVLQAALQGSVAPHPSHVVVTPVLLLVCALLATALPARRATRIQPLSLMGSR